MVDVIDPVLCFGVPAEGLGIFETLPVAINLSIGWMVLDCLQHAVGRHDLRHILGVTAAMNEEGTQQR